VEELLEKARKLGKAMTETEQYEKLREAEKQLNEDVEAQALLEGMQQAQDKVQQLQQSGLQPTEDQVEELNEKRSQMDQNPAVSNFMKAQSEFSELVREVNGAISEGMKLEESEEQE